MHKTGILQVDNVATPVVSNVFDGTGELIAGVASVQAVVRFFLKLYNTICTFEKREKYIYQLLNYFECFGQENFITSSWIYHFRNHIANAPLVMLDANLSPESLKAACISKLFHLKFCRAKLICTKIFLINYLLMMTWKVTIESPFILSYIEINLMIKCFAYKITQNV